MGNYQQVNREKQISFVRVNLNGAIKTIWRTDKSLHMLSKSISSLLLRIKTATQNC